MNAYHLKTTAVRLLDLYGSSLTLEKITRGSYVPNLGLAPETKTVLETKGIIKTVSAELAGYPEIQGWYQTITIVEQLEIGDYVIQDGNKFKVLGISKIVQTQDVKILNSYIIKDL